MVRLLQVGAPLPKEYEVAVEPFRIYAAYSCDSATNEAGGDGEFAYEVNIVLPERSAVGLSIYDAAGRIVRTLVDGALDAGFTEVTWDGRDAGGRPASSGVYFYRLDAGGRVLTKRMVLLK